MYKKTTLFLTVILIIVISFAFILTQKEKQISEEQKEQSVLLSFDIEKIDGIEMSIGENSFALQKKEDGNWLETKPYTFPAKKATIDELLEDLKNAKIVNLVSLDKKLAKKYGLTEEERRNISLKNTNEVLMTLRLGKAAKGVERMYAMIEPNEMIVLLAGLDPFVLETDYRDHTILGFDSEIVSSVEYTHTTPANNFMLSKTEEKWFLATSADSEKIEVADQDAAKNFFQNGARLEAIGIPLQTTTFQESGLKATYKIPNKNYEVTFGQTLEGESMLVKNQDDFLYVVDKEALTEIFPSQELLLKN